MSGLSAEFLRRLAEERLADARLLIANERFSSAYYLAGYAIELALKARIAKSFKAETIPDRTLVQSLYVHKLSELMRLADLADDMRDATSANGELALNWSIVSGWDVSSRYAIFDRERSERLLNAVGHPKDGVFAWLRTHWSAPTSEAAGVSFSGSTSTTSGLGRLYG